MQRIESLIAKLNEQYTLGADPSQMLATVQQLQNELSQLQPRPAKTLGTSKVAVMMPSVMPAEYERYMPRKTAPEEKAPEIKAPEIKASEVKAPEIKTPVVEERNSSSIVHDNGQLDMAFDPMIEIPTLSHQVYDNLVKAERAKGESESVNDKLKQSTTELFEVLKETPIQDLRKAIGINDRFLFIDDLFRGDEAMYERSIKTINGFSRHVEAEYWISRELKVKLGWPNDHKTVQHFDQLVRRRFS